MDNRGHSHCLMASGDSDYIYDGRIYTYSSRRCHHYDFGKSNQGIEDK